MLDRRGLSVRQPSGSQAPASFSRFLSAGEIRRKMTSLGVQREAAIQFSQRHAGESFTQPDLEREADNLALANGGKALLRRRENTQAESARAMNARQRAYERPDFNRAEQGGTRGAPQSANVNLNDEDVAAALYKALYEGARVGMSGVKEEIRKGNKVRLTDTSTPI